MYRHGEEAVKQIILKYVYDFIMSTVLTAYGYCLIKTEVGRNWYLSIHFDELSYRQVSFLGPQWTPSR
jgi:hypothetical protein